MAPQHPAVRAAYDAWRLGEITASCGSVMPPDFDRIDAMTRLTWADVATAVWRVCVEMEAGDGPAEIVPERVA